MGTEKSCEKTFPFWAEVDVILAVGTRLREQYRRWGIEDDMKVIRIDIDPMELERNGKPAVGILADAKLALAALAERWGAYSPATVA